MKKILIGILVLVILFIIFLAFGPKKSEAPANNSTSTSATSTVTSSNTHTVTGGELSFTVPADFALAVTPAQVLVKSYIPPCEQGFDYCIYYSGSDYKGTNFESAGIRINARKDLAIQNTCLTTEPAGFNVKSTTINSTTDYFDVSQAAAGHFSSGKLYRLFYNNHCYELETRVGQSQYANYPSGTIKQFTTADSQTLESRLEDILRGIKLSNGTSMTL